MAELVAVAGSRWAVEESFQAAKNEVALDQYQVRKHAAWYRHVTLAMCALAWLAVTAAANRPPPVTGLGDVPGDGRAARRAAESDLRGQGTARRAGRRSAGCLQSRDREPRRRSCAP